MSRDSILDSALPGEMNNRSKFLSAWGQLLIPRNGSLILGFILHSDEIIHVIRVSQALFDASFVPRVPLP